ncbi:MAG TPA: ABC transporter ATP-binding protein [Candidatus Saccharimonadales bacterium]|nr:ABC transporter ATP-binding protein [Candidatus Saccharimonadales bacterium]
MGEDVSVDRSSIRLFWQATLRAPRHLLWLAALSPIGSVFLNTVVPLFVGKILASLGHGNAPTMHYVWYFGAAAAIGFTCNRIGFVSFLRLQAEVMRLLQEQALAALLRRSVGFHNNNVGGKLVSDAIDFPNGFGQVVNGVVTNLLPLGMILLAGTAVIFSESWKLGLVILLMTVVTIGSGIYESNRRSGLRRNRLIVTKDLTSHLADTILNVQTVKTFAREDDELQSHAVYGRKLADMRLRDWGKAAQNGSNRVAALLVMQAVFVVVVLRLVQHDPALLGIGIFAFSFTITLSNRLFDINNMLRAAEDGLLMASPMTEILQQDIEITDRPGAKALQVPHGAIDLQNVTFEYRDETTAQTVFEKLNVAIKAGEKIGLVGPSGGGKSTLTRLLLRFEDIASGEILIDGQNVAAVTQASLRSKISYVPQEPLLFHRSVRENIAYGSPGVALAKVRRAAGLAHADEFIDKLKDSYDTVVGERGVKLSGGQRQRIAIARAILKDAPILILDEATSALDSESEVLIQDALWKLMQNRTAIVIAHRLSTIQKMDRILVLDEGEIVEQGTHAELLKHKGLYAKLWKHQSGGFIED